MYLFDTNVVSVLRKPSLLDRHVAERLAAIPETRIFFSVMTLMELELGVVSMERKDVEQGRHLRQWFEQMRSDMDDKRILYRRAYEITFLIMTLMELELGVVWGRANPHRREP